MSTTVAITEARARLAAAEQELREEEAKIASAQAAQVPARARLERWRRKTGKRPIIVHGPNTYEVKPDGLAAVTVPYGGDRPILAAKPRERAELVMGVNLDAHLANSPGGKARGIAQRSRYVDAVTMKRLDRLDRAARRAEDAGRAARKLWLDAKCEAFEAGDKVPVEDLVAVVLEGLPLRAAVKEVSMLDTYKSERIRDHDLVEARTHLTHALARSKDLCLCSRCRSNRQQAEWERQNAERQKARIAADKAEAKVLARAPKLRFLCPMCEGWQISPEFDDGGSAPYVSCQNEDCGATTIVTAIKGKRVPRSTPAQDLGPDWIEPAPGQATLEGATA